MKQENTPKKSLTRREFLKRFHSAAAVTCASTWVGCTPGQKNTDVQTSEVSSKKKGEMTYRITPNTGDKVSLLGYGCLRWASVLDKETGDIDQEGVNKLVDYAIEHGVNYFDAAPMYLNGECERIGSLFKAHCFPENDEALNCFVKSFSTVFGNLCKSINKKSKLFFSFAFCNCQFFFCNFFISF